MWFEEQKEKSKKKTYDYFYLCIINYFKVLICSQHERFLGQSDHERVDFS